MIIIKLLWNASSVGQKSSVPPRFNPALLFGSSTSSCSGHSCGTSSLVSTLLLLPPLTDGGDRLLFIGNLGGSTTVSHSGTSIVNNFFSKFNFHNNKFVIMELSLSLPLCLGSQRDDLAGPLSVIGHRLIGDL